MATLSRKHASDSTVIPDRLYFKIGDVARIAGLETYVLRFWESQFPQLKPNKSGTGQRLYRRREVELVLEIKRLVHSEGYTLPGARQALEQQGRKAVNLSSSSVRDLQDHQAAPDLRPVHGPLTGLPAAQPAPPSRRMDIATATIGHARAELRALAELLAAPAQRTLRRRTRLATMPGENDMLFPS